MKRNRFLQVVAGSLALLAGPTRADQLDEMINGMRSGASPAAIPNQEIQNSDAYKSAHAIASQTYRDGLVSLYLFEIKLSIVDPAQNGGWPYRSFLLDRFIEEEDGAALRKNLTDALKERFTAKPDAMLAYALVCPALFAGDETLLGQAQDYLKEHDPFLFKLEQDRIEAWRPQIKNALANEERARAMLRDGSVAKLSDLLVQHGHDAQLNEPVTTSLGLTSAGGALTLRQLGIAEKGKTGHAYMRTADGGFLLFTVSTVSTRAYRASAKRELVGAVDKKTGAPPMLIPVPDAKKELEAEFVYWFAIADRF